MTALVSANGKDFQTSLAAWAKKSADKLDGLTRQCCQELSEKVVVSTPVDTGFLRGSWQPSIGAPSTKDSTKEDKTGGQALSDISLTITNVKAGDRYFLVNNASYARHVEYGTHKMQGRFYVLSNVKKWRYIVTRVAKQLGLK